MWARARKSDHMVWCLVCIVCRSVGRIVIVTFDSFGMVKKDICCGMWNVPIYIFITTHSFACGKNLTLKHITNRGKKKKNWKQRARVRERNQIVEKTNYQLSYTMQTHTISMNIMMITSDMNQPSRRRRRRKRIEIETHERKKPTNNLNQAWRRHGPSRWKLFA